MKLPVARGPISAQLLDQLLSSPSAATDTAATLGEPVRAALAATPDMIFDEDLQLALFCLYELHYSGFDGVDDGWEWAPELMIVRQQLEQEFEKKMRAAVDLPERPEPTSDAVAAALFRLTGADSGPSVSRYVAKKATRHQLDEFLIHKSIYQLKEADPHTWAIPRLTGRAKAAMVEIQADEYGGGRPDRIHSVLFARTMCGVGLDGSYGAYVDSVPAITLASHNMTSLFGLNRRLRGAIVGHLAAYEMTSSQPNRLYGNGFRRHGFGAEVTEYFDEHVEADAVHEQIAGRDLAGGLVEAEPDLLDEVFFGAVAALTIDSWMSTHILSAWEADRTSLQVLSAAR